MYYVTLVQVAVTITLLLAKSCTAGEKKYKHELEVDPVEIELRSTVDHEFNNSLSQDEQLTKNQWLVIIHPNDTSIEVGSPLQGKAHTRVILPFSAFQKSNEVLLRSKSQPTLTFDGYCGVDEYGDAECTTNHCSFGTQKYRMESPYYQFERSQILGDLAIENHFQDSSSSVTYCELMKEVLAKLVADEESKFNQMLVDTQNEFTQKEDVVGVSEALIAALKKKAASKVLQSEESKPAPRPLAPPVPGAAPSRPASPPLIPGLNPAMLAAKRAGLGKGDENKPNNPKLPTPASNGLSMDELKAAMARRKQIIPVAKPELQATQEYKPDFVKPSMLRKAGAAGRFRLPEIKKPEETNELMTFRNRLKPVGERRLP